VSKRTNPAFVAQINAEIGEIAETFDAAGEPGPTYKITAIDEAADSITLVDNTGAELIINANFTGIPRDTAFAVLRPRQPVEVEEEGVELAEESDAAEDEEFTDVLDAEIEEAGGNEVDEISEVPTSQRIYSDAVQRNDMLQEMVSFLDKASQKNPERHKQIRTLIEQCMLLRNTIVEYSAAGEPVGPISTSIGTISDLLSTTNVPLSRPVLKAKRVLYLDHTDSSLYQTAQGNSPTDPTEIRDADVDIRYLDDTVNEVVEYMKTQLGGISSQVLSPDSLPEWYLHSRCSSGFESVGLSKS
jgi:hypothetical protein